MREKKESAKGVRGYLTGSCFLPRRELGNRAGRTRGGERRRRGDDEEEAAGKGEETRLTGLVTRLESKRRQGRPVWNFQSEARVFKECGGPAGPTRGCGVLREGGRDAETQGLSGQLRQSTRLLGVASLSRVPLLHGVMDGRDGRTEAPRRRARR